MPKRKSTLLEYWCPKPGKVPSPSISSSVEEKECNNNDPGVQAQETTMIDGEVNGRSDQVLPKPIEQQINDCESSKKATKRVPSFPVSGEVSASSGSAPSDVNEIGAYQPKCIPHQEVKGRRFNFQLDWYKKFKWVHYDSSKKKILCICCVEAKTKGLFPEGTSCDETFDSVGFDDWKHGLQNFKIHDGSKHHNESVRKLLVSKEAPIVQLLCSSTSKKQNEARNALTAIFTSVIYLAKQGLALRGNDTDSANFDALLKLRAHDIEDLQKWLRRPKPYTSPEIQNEVLKTVALTILRNIIRTIKAAKYFSLIVDESTDMSVKEQVSISVRIVNSDFEPEEYFLGLYETNSTTGEALTTIILDCLQRFDLPIEDLRGQCYDGAKNMSGEFRGVQSRILAMQPRAIFVHCFNHSLNLALQDTVSKLPFFRDTLQIVNDIGVILKASPKRMGEFDAILRNLEYAEITPKPRLLCPTRWSVRVKAIEAILANYNALLVMMDQLHSSNDKVASTAGGLYLKLEKGELYLGLLMAKTLFEAAERFSKVLQNPKSTVCGSIEAAKVVIEELEGLRTEEHFNLHWESMSLKINECELGEPVLPRKRGRPKRFRDGDEPGLASTSPKEMLQSTYFDAIDIICEEIAHRFIQPGLQVYEKMESALMHDMQNNENEALDSVCQFYDWNFEKLLNELRVLKASSKIPWSSVNNIVNGFKGLKSEVRGMFPGVDEYLKILLVLPCSSATAERSFSRLRRVKSYLRTTMGQERLNHCCIINCYSDLVEQLNINMMLQEFVQDKNREATFGKFC